MNFDLSFMNNKKVVLLFTPGIDTFMTSWVLNNHKIDYLSFNKIYFDINGLYSKEEIQFLKDLYNDFDIEKLPLDKLENKENAHVLNRNMIFVTHAQCLYNSDVVLISGVKDDRVSDNNKEFFDKLSNVLSLSSGKQITVTSLFWEYEKSELIKEYIKHNNSIDLIEKTFSCYFPNKTNELKITPIFEKVKTKFILKDKVKAYSGCRKCKACFRKYCALTSSNIYVPFLNPYLCREYSLEDLTTEYPNRQITINDYLFFNNWIKNITY